MCMFLQVSVSIFAYILSIQGLVKIFSKIIILKHMFIAMMLKSQAVWIIRASVGGGEE